MPNQTNIIQVEEITKRFTIGEQEIQILKGVSFEVHFGEFVIIFGPSGCGKSTLLHIVLGLEKPTTGKVIFLDENIYDDTDEDYRSNFRKKHIGMVYQQANWIKSLNVGENVAFPLMLLGMDKNEAFEKSVEMLARVGMDKWAKYIPTELSSGQQQRVALARSLINNPEIIVADEPTGNLDFTSGQDMMQLLHDLNTQQKKTIIMVTHDLEYLKFASSAVRMLDGKIVNHYGANDMDQVLSSLQLKRGVPGSADSLDLYKAEDTIHSKKTTKNSTVNEADMIVPPLVSAPQIDTPQSDSIEKTDTESSSPEIDSEKSLPQNLSATIAPAIDEKDAEESKSVNNKQKISKEKKIDRSLPVEQDVKRMKVISKT